MKNFITAMTALTVFAALHPVAAAPAAEGTVTGSGINIRQRPDTSAAIVGKLNSGDKVTVLAANPEWLKIRLVAGSETYISKDFIKDGKTTARINVRSGPNTASDSYGILPAGVEVKVIGAPADGPWVKIEPPEFAVGYVATKLVKTGSAELPGLKAEAAPAKPAAGHAKPEDPDLPFKDLPVKKGSARNVTLSGLLVPVKSAAPNVKYALAVEKSGKYEVAAFIHTMGSSTFDAFANKLVKLSGVRYDVPDWKNPVMRVTKITAQ
jgi:uncharacterized protein YraI